MKHNSDRELIEQSCMGLLLLLSLLFILVAGCGGDDGSDEDGDDSDEPGDKLADVRPIIEEFQINPNEAQDLSAESGAGVSFAAGSLELEGGGEAGEDATVVLENYLYKTGGLVTDMPGGFLGVDENGQEMALLALGVIGVSITDADDQALNLKSGSEAILTIPSLVDNGPESAPLWLLDEATGVWHEEGVSTRDGSEYKGTVTHFSTWNVDLACMTACIEGKVQTSSGKPLPNVNVLAVTKMSTCQSFMPGLLSGGGDTSNSDGSYRISALPGDSMVDLSAEYDGVTFRKGVVIPDAGDSCVQYTIVFEEDDGPPPTGGCEASTLTSTLWGGVGAAGECMFGEHYFDVKFLSDGTWRTFMRCWDTGDAECHVGFLLSGTWVLDDCVITVQQKLANLITAAWEIKDGKLVFKEGISWEYADGSYYETDNPAVSYMSWGEATFSPITVVQTPYCDSVDASNFP